MLDIRWVVVFENYATSDSWIHIQSVIIATYSPRECFAFSRALFLSLLYKMIARPSYYYNRLPETYSITVFRIVYVID